MNKLALYNARSQACESAKPFKTFQELTGHWPIDFPFNSTPDQVVLTCPTSWLDLTRIKEVLILKSLDLNHEPITERSKKSSGILKPERQRFILEDL